MRSGAEHLRATRATRDKQALAAFLLSALAVLGFALATHHAWSNRGLHLGMALGLISLSYLAIKMYFATSYNSFDNQTPHLTTAVVIPVYNEDPTAFTQCLNSVLNQSHPATEIWVIDDASPDATCAELAEQLLSNHNNARVIRAEENRGKRHAQSHAFTNSTADVFITLDSDTILDPDAIKEGLRPFATDDTIQAVTGNVRVLNWDENVLTRLTTIRYANSFLWERAAYSRLNGSVLCCCGALSFWRADLIKEHLEDYLTQTFLGVEVPYGDDRRLTNYALSKGRVVLQDTALGYTAVPQRWSHYLRQQARWNKSFFRESLWTLTNLFHNKRVWLLASAEISLWVAAFTLITVRYVWDVAHLSADLPLYLIWFGTMMSYARSVRFLGSQEMSRTQQWSTFLLAPLYWVFTLTILVPLRFISLMTMKSGSWGTRRKVEVSLAEASVPTS